MKTLKEASKAFNSAHWDLEHARREYDSLQSKMDDLLDNIASKSEVLREAREALWKASIDS